MSCCDSTTSASGPALQLAAPKRNHYYFSKMMDVLQFELETSYHSRQRQLMNRLSVGTGVLCGLGVEADDNKLCVLPGVALDHVGHEVIVPGRYCIDPWLIPGECGQPAQTRSRTETHRITLCLGYHECLADYAPVMLTDCRTGPACEAGSIVESFKLFVRDGWPDAGPDFCETLNAKGAVYEMVGTVDTGGTPRAVAVAANGRRALVMNDAPAPLLQVVDLQSRTVIATFAEAVKAPLGGVSVAPDGGPALVTHVGGIVAVDLEAEVPTIVATVPSTVPYGPCVATHQGTRLYTLAGKDVRRVNMGSPGDAVVHSGDSPNDLAVSADNAALFVADSGTKTLARIDTATDAVAWTKTLDEAASSLSATGSAAEIVAWALVPNAIRRFDAAGLAQDAASTLTPADSGFSGDERVAVVHKNGDTPDLVVLARANAAELARVALPAEASGMAAVPGRATIVVAHPGNGTLSIVDDLDLRTRLCRALSGPCPAPDESPCVVLATLELLPDGTLGEIDTCSHRTRILSNQKLLELVLCLAEACCGAAPAPHAPPPKPEDPPPPAPLVLTRVASVEFLRGNNVTQQVTNPVEGVLLLGTRAPDAIRIRFTGQIQTATVTSGGLNADPKTFSLLIQGGPSTLPMNFIPGSVTPTSADTVVFKVDPEFKQFSKGDYTFLLAADVDPAGLRPAVTDNAGHRLDGNPKTSFPSGDGAEGGDFAFKFAVN